MIPIADPELGAREKERVEAVLDSGQLADGPEVRAFEVEFADFCGATHGVATTNGTTALHTACEALGLGPGDTVVTTTVVGDGAHREVAVDPAPSGIDAALLEAHELGVPIVVDRVLLGVGEDPVALDQRIRILP